MFFSKISVSFLSDIRVGFVMRELHYWHINYVKMNPCLQEKCSVAHKFENFLCSSRTLVLLEYYIDPVAYYLCKGKLIPLSILLYYFLLGLSPNVISPKPLFNCRFPAPSHVLLEAVNSCFPHCQVPLLG